MIYIDCKTTNFSLSTIYNAAMGSSLHNSSSFAEMITFHCMSQPIYQLSLSSSLLNSTSFANMTKMRGNNPTLTLCNTCVDDKDLRMIEVGSNEIDYFYADSCTISRSMCFGSSCGKCVNSINIRLILDT